MSPVSLLLMMMNEATTKWSRQEY